MSGIGCTCCGAFLWGCVKKTSSPDWLQASPLFLLEKKNQRSERNLRRQKSLEWSSAPCCQLTVATLLLVIFAWKWINMWPFFSQPPQSTTCPPSRQNLLLPAQGSHRRGTRRPNWTLQLLFAPTEIHRHLECTDIMIWVNWSHEIEKNTHSCIHVS